MRKTVIIAVIAMLALMGFATVRTFDPYRCARVISNAIQDETISSQEFRTIVEKNKRGINSPMFRTRIHLLEEISNFYPIQTACKEGAIERVKILLECGAKTDVIDDTIGTTPLIITLHSGEKSRFEIANMLLDYGADPELNSSRNESVIFGSLILVHGENTDKQEKDSLNLFAGLYNMGVCTEDPNGRDTLLGDAVAFNNMRAVEYILDNDIQGINEVSELGISPLMESVFASDNPEMCVYLISRGADVTLQDKEGKTALNYGPVSRFSTN